MNVDSRVESRVGLMNILKSFELSDKFDLGITIFGILTIYIKNRIILVLPTYFINYY